MQGNVAMPDMEAIRKTAESITLVPATSEHAQLLHTIFTGRNTRKYGPVSRTSVAALARSLAQSGKDFSEKALFYRIFGQTDGDLFGSVVFKNIDWEEREAEIGFSLLDSFQGRGLGSALVHKCVMKLFRESPIERLWATVSVGNAACRRLMRSLQFDECGFYKEEFLINGELVSQILYRMSRK